MCERVAALKVVWRLLNIKTNQLLKRAKKWSVCADENPRESQARRGGTHSSRGTTCVCRRRMLDPLVRKNRILCEELQPSIEQLHRRVGQEDLSFRQTDRFERRVGWCWWCADNARSVGGVMTTWSTMTTRREPSRAEIGKAFVQKVALPRSPTMKRCPFPRRIVPPRLTEFPTLLIFHRDNEDDVTLVGRKGSQAMCPVEQVSGNEHYQLRPKISWVVCEVFRLVVASWMWVESHPRTSIPRVNTRTHQGHLLSSVVDFRYAPRWREMMTCRFTELPWSRQRICRLCQEIQKVASQTLIWWMNRTSRTGRWRGHGGFLGRKVRGHRGPPITPHRVAEVPVWGVNDHQSNFPDTSRRVSRGEFAWWILDASFPNRSAYCSRRGHCGEQCERSSGARAGMVLLLPALSSSGDSGKSWCSGGRGPLYDGGSSCCSQRKVRCQDGHNPSTAGGGDNETIWSVVQTERWNWKPMSLQASKALPDHGKRSADPRESIPEFVLQYFVLNKECLQWTIGHDDRAPTSSSRQWAIRQGLSSADDGGCSSAWSESQPWGREMVVSGGRRLVLKGDPSHDVEKVGQESGGCNSYIAPRVVGACWMRMRRARLAEDLRPRSLNHCDLQRRHQCLLDLPDSHAQRLASVGRGQPRLLLRPVTSSTRSWKWKRGNHGMHWYAYCFTLDSTTSCKLHRGMFVQLFERCLRGLHLRTRRGTFRHPPWRCGAPSAWREKRRCGIKLESCQFLATCFWADRPRVQPRSSSSNTRTRNENVGDDSRTHGEDDGRARLLSRTPAAPDVQSAWLLLLHIFQERDTYLQSIVQPALSEH